MEKRLSAFELKVIELHNLLLNERQVALRCLETVQESLEILRNNSNPDHEKGLQDSVIKRFEYTIDYFWKYLKLYMVENEKMEVLVSSPKAILKEAFTVGLIRDDELRVLEKALNSRNLTSHMYHEEVSLDILDQVPKCYESMLQIINRLKIK